MAQHHLATQILPGMLEAEGAFSWTASSGSGATWHTTTTASLIWAESHPWKDGSRCGGGQQHQIWSDAGMTQPCSPSAGIPSGASVTCTGWLDCIIVLGDSCAVQPSFLELRSRTEHRAAAEANNFTLQVMAFISTMDQKKEQPTKSS
ncbi:unnamed protein product [Natator depressus]